MLYLDARSFASSLKLASYSSSQTQDVCNPYQARRQRRRHVKPGMPPMPSSIKYGAPFVSTNLEVKKSYRKFALVRIKVNDLVPCKEKTLTSTSGLFLPHLILKSPSLSAWLLPYCCLTHSKRRRWRKERKKIRSRVSLCIRKRKKKISAKQFNW